MSELSAIAQFQDTIDDMIIHHPTKSKVLKAVKAEKDTYRALMLALSSIDVSFTKKQSIIEIDEFEPLVIEVIAMLYAEAQKSETNKRIQDQIKESAEKSAKAYYLSEQRDAIEKELRTLNDEDEDDIASIKKKAEKTPLSDEAKEKVKKEIKKLENTNPMAAEASVIRNYLDTILSLPWGVNEPINTSLSDVEKTLNERQYGLEEVKERVLEQLAVYPNSQGTVMCLVGPPGVAKTSIAQSIAAAQNRAFIRVPLGGVRDEAEIRGHRRTYIGSMPGKVVAALQKAKSNNPIILLDEIDKMSSDQRGDPASALLEVLDPSQNRHFQDHYLELEYDISGITFICTANYIDQIPRPLLDRMEVIKVDGYSDEEKLHIAKNHLIPKAEKELNIGTKVVFTDEAILAIINQYTMESGVRKLEQLIKSVYRKVAKKSLLSTSKIKGVKITPSLVNTLLGNKYVIPSRVNEVDLVGSVLGMAYNGVGGDVLPIDCVAMPGSGNVKVTGQLGSVMQESVENAISYIRHNNLFPVKKLNSIDLHIHAGDGSTPKDGPSAGVTLVTTITSCLLNKPVDRRVAMTGEITLRGRVCAIGGVKEKLMAATRAGVTKVYIPKDNMKDVPKGCPLKIVPVTDVKEILIDLKLIKGKK